MARQDEVCVCVYAISYPNHTLTDVVQTIFCHFLLPPSQSGWQGRFSHFSSFPSTTRVRGRSIITVPWPPSKPSRSCCRRSGSVACGCVESKDDFRAVQIISCATLMMCVYTTPTCISVCVCVCVGCDFIICLTSIYRGCLLGSSPCLKRVIIISLPWHTADASGLTQWHKSCSNAGRKRFDWWDDLVYMLQGWQKWAAVQIYNVILI